MNLRQGLRRASLGLALIVLLGGQEGEQGETIPATDVIAKVAWAYVGDTGPGGGAT